MKIERTGNHIRIRLWYFLDEKLKNSYDEEFSVDKFEFIDNDK